MPTHIDFASIANQLRKRALSGSHRGTDSVADHSYVRHCRVRAGRATVIFTRDTEQHTCGWLADPALEHCWHLSVACESRTERDEWLRAFFGVHLGQVWAE